MRHISRSDVSASVSYGFCGSGLVCRENQGLTGQLFLLSIAYRYPGVDPGRMMTKLFVANDRG